MSAYHEVFERETLLVLPTTRPEFRAVEVIGSTPRVRVRQNAYYRYLRAFFIPASFTVSRGY